MVADEEDDGEEISWFCPQSAVTMSPTQSAVVAQILIELVESFITGT